MFSHLSVELPLAADAPALRVHEFEWYQNRYQHDFGVLTFMDWGVDPGLVTPGTPISVEVIQVDSAKTFYGYIHHTEHKKSSHKSYTCVYVIGASYVMKQPSQKVYANMTSSSIAVDVAKKYGFSYDVVPHPRVYPQVSQAGDTDWEMLVKLAKQSGYTLRSDATTLYFKPVTEDFDAFKAGATNFFSIPPGNSIPPSLYSIEPIIGESIEYEDGHRAAPALLGIDVAAGKAFKVVNPTKPNIRQGGQSPEFFDMFAVHTATPSLTAATQETRAIDERSRFAYRANAVLKGTPTLRPDLPVKFSGVDSEIDGHWMVLEAVHKVNKEGYTTEVLVGKELRPGTESETQLLAPVALLPQAPTLRVNRRPLKQEKEVVFGKVANRLSAAPKTSVSAIWIGSGGNARNMVTRAKAAATLRK